MWGTVLRGGALSVAFIGATVLVAPSALAAGSTFYNTGALSPWTGGGYEFSEMHLLTPDGNVAAGQSTNSDGVTDWYEAFVWTEAGGIQGLGVLGVHTTGQRYSNATVISSDGSVIAGLSSNSDGVSDWGEAFRWTQGGGMQGLGVLNVSTTGFRFSNVNAMSSDGLAIAGQSSNSDGVTDWAEAYRWTQSGGMQGLGVLSIFTDGSRTSTAYLMSADGAVVAGQSGNSNGIVNWYEAFRWTQGTGMQGLGVLGVFTFGDRNSAANAMASDGFVVVGQSSNSNGTDDWYEAFRWTQGGGMQGLGVLSVFTFGGRYSTAYNISSDGLVIVGQSSNSDGVNDWTEAFRWTQGGGMQGLGVVSVFTTGSRYSNPRFLSSDGAVIAGQSSNSDGVSDWYEAFRWTQGGGMQGLGVLGVFTYGDRYSDVAAMTPDGSVIVGLSSNSDGVNNYDEAFRWSVTGGMQTVADWIGPSVDLTGLRIVEAQVVSADGNTIVGTLLDTSTGNYTAYWARVGGLLDPDVLGASLHAMLPLAGAAAAAGSSSLDALAEIAAHHRCGERASESVCLFAAGSDSNWINNSADTEAPAGTFGASAYLAPGWRLGLAALVNRTRTDELAFDTYHTVEGIGGGLFVSYGTDAGLILETAVMADLFEADANRGYLNGVALDMSRSTTTGSSYGAQARVGWAFPFGAGFSLTPFADASVVQTRLKGFQETTGPFPARFDEQSDTATRARLGGELKARLFDNLSLWGSGAWGHRFDDHGADLSGEVSGIGLFDIDGPAIQTDWAEGVAGVELSLLESMFLTASLTGRSTNDDLPDLEGRIALSIWR